MDIDEFHWFGFVSFHLPVPFVFFPKGHLRVEVVSCQLCGSHRQVLRIAYNMNDKEAKENHGLHSMDERYPQNQSEWDPMKYVHVWVPVE